MKISFLLHFYQPYNQQDDILQRIVHECYLPITRGLLGRPAAKLNININAALTELLIDKGYGEVVENIAKLSGRGQVELTGSAKYHAFLPLIPQSELERQVKINTSTNQQHLGDTYEPVGFFPPEMAVSPQLLERISSLGFKWTAAPQVSSSLKEGLGDYLYKDSQSQLNVFLRNKRVSSLLLSGVCRDAADFIEQTKDLHSDKYWFCVMDAETFGHHRIGHEKFLFDVLDNPFFEPVTASDLMNEPLPLKEITIRPSTWTNEEQDFWLDREQNVPTTAKSFILWRDPENPIHKLQWELLDLAVSEVNNYDNKAESRYLEARGLLDSAIASDQFWWASAKPWWSLEMLEQGAYALKTVLSTLASDSQCAKTAEELYRRILDQAFEWQRTGYIRKKHLDNSSTHMKEPFKKRAPAEWYNQMILEFEDEMNKAAQRRDFEKAIKWRDALIKLHNETDIYDVLHVVDELWSARSIPEVKPFLEHKPDEFSDFAKNLFRPL